jgi:Erg28 like protein
MEQLASYLPSSEGLLPKWLLIVQSLSRPQSVALMLTFPQVSAISVANSIQAITNPTYSHRVYTGSKSSKGTPVTALSSRTFGTWTLLSSVIRLYAAYYVNDPLIYQLACWSYAIAFAHFSSEWLIFKTTSLSPGLISILVVSTGTLSWMLMWKDFYVK